MGRATGEYTERFLAPLDRAEREALVASLVKLYAGTAEGRRIPPAAAGAGQVRS
jgi:hypothetical protein